MKILPKQHYAPKVAAYFGYRIELFSPLGGTLHCKLVSNKCGPNRKNSECC